VFPIQLPPLRERGDDVVRLAEIFAQRFAQRMGRTVAALTPDCIRRLKTYGWPGNVRELQNVIERAVITTRDGRLNLDRALPEAVSSLMDEPLACKDGGTPSIRTARELSAMERENILRALETADWKVSGEKGAARLLGMNPSTLASRMKALGIARRSRS
jgi:transcriptional regulator with GAF, ATPase, and Fis domain